MGQAVPSTSIVVPSRRALLTGAVALTSTAVAVKGSGRRPADWQAFIDKIAALHPNGRRAAELAYQFRDKVKLADYSGVTLTGSGRKGGYPVLMFGDWTRRAIMVTPNEAWEGGPVPRGTGPWLVQPRKAGVA